MPRKKTTVSRVNKTDWFHPGDLKGFLLMLLALILVVLSTLAVKALAQSQDQEAQVMDILLSEMVNSKEDGVCSAERKNLDLSGGDEYSCFKRAEIVCNDGSKKVMLRQECMSSEKWSVFADAYCGSIEIACKQ